MYTLKCTKCGVEIQVTWKTPPDWTCSFCAQVTKPIPIVKAPPTTSKKGD